MNSEDTDTAYKKIKNVDIGTQERNGRYRCGLHGNNKKVVDIGGIYTRIKIRLKIGLLYTRITKVNIGTRE